MVWAEMVMGRFGYGPKWPVTGDNVDQQKNKEDQLNQISASAV